MDSKSFPPSVPGLPPFLVCSHYCCSRRGWGGKGYFFFMCLTHRETTYGLRYTTRVITTLCTHIEVKGRKGEARATQKAVFSWLMELEVVSGPIGSNTLPHRFHRGGSGSPDRSSPITPQVETGTRQSGRTLVFQLRALPSLFRTCFSGGPLCYSEELKHFLSNCDTLTAVPRTLRK